jgi:hypothetical protein
MMRECIVCYPAKLESALRNDQKTERARAEALFKKEEQIREGAKAMAEYKAEQKAVREKTARLRALRLARDAAKEATASSQGQAR